MAKGRTRKKSTEEKTFFAPRQQSRPIVALVLLCIGLLMLVALIGYQPAQSAQNAAGVDVAGNPVGQYGAEFCATAYKVFGYVAWAVPLLFLWAGALCFFKRAQRVRWLFLLAVVGLLLSLTGLFTMSDKHSVSAAQEIHANGVQWTAGITSVQGTALPSGSGGQLGLRTYNDLFIRYIGPFGNGLLLVIVLLLSVNLLFPEPIVLFWRYLRDQWVQWRTARRNRKEMIRQARLKMANEKERQKILALEARRAQKAAQVQPPRPPAAQIPQATQPAPAPSAPQTQAPTQAQQPARTRFERGTEAFPATKTQKPGLFARLFGLGAHAPASELVERQEGFGAGAPAQSGGDPVGNSAHSAFDQTAAASFAGQGMTAKRLQAKSAPSFTQEAGIRLSKDDPFTVPLEDGEAFNDEAQTDNSPYPSEQAKPFAEPPTSALTPPAAASAPAQPMPAATPPAQISAASGLKVVETEKTEKADIARPERRGDYIFPSIDLLSEPPADSNEDNSQDYEQMMDLLIETLDQFNVKVEKEQVTTGPVITRYEVKPAPGVRVEKILSLDKNLALSLMADSVRILAPVPGRGTVGIEIPNKKPKAVCMREIVESRAWVDAKAEIPVVLGKDVTGRPIVEDLTKMPHMLIAGSTGSGKTVCINAIIASLLYHAGPEDLRFIMVDPKVVEMQVYNALPHMLIPVVTDPKKVPGALKYLLNEMERRYRVFAKVGVRNIAGFNKKLAKDKAEREKLEAMEREQAASLSIEERAAAAEIEVPRDDDVLEVPTKKFPYIVCIIDELADLMMVAPQDIETGVARLAQLARAAGIHLILATQRPSVNVITGVIKANLPTRISFKVASKVDSRTILDQMGADALIGRGDMLFIPPGTSNLVRAQGAFVSDEEINAIVEYLSDKNGEPEYAEEVQAAIEAAGEDGAGAGAGEYDDELVPQAIEIIRTHQRASTSFLQRKLKIGYNRAARIMDILEDEGIVGPDNGPSSPREILD